MDLMSEKPPGPGESSQSEGLTSWDVLLTPGVTIGIVGTGNDGLSLPVHFRTGTPKESASGGDTNPSLEHLETNVTQLPKDLTKHVIEMRNSEEAMQSFKEKGFYRQSFVINDSKYVVLYVRSEDARRREGFKGIFVGWDTNDGMLDRKMSATFFRNNETDVALDLWVTIYSNPEKTLGPGEKFEGEYFAPPS
jgi:hypothetical protein